MNERNYARQLQHIPGIVENTARSFARVALSPTAAIEGISELLLEYDVGSRRRRRALIPSSRNRGYGCFGFHREVAQPTASDQRAIGLAQHGQLTQTEVFVASEE